MSVVGECDVICVECLNVNQLFSFMSSFLNLPYYYFFFFFFFIFFS
jgi:hypothetical protein